MGLLIGLKDNKYPEFWESYLSCFDSKLKRYRETCCGFDTETTGLKQM
jgi:DNA polymerase-3 subunit epsilon